MINLRSLNQGTTIMISLIKIKVQMVKNVLVVVLIILNIAIWREMMH